METDQLHKNGARIRLMPCVRAGPGQLWFYDATGLVRSRAPLGAKDFCVDAPARLSPGSVLQLWECWEDNLAQQWFVGDGAWVAADKVFSPPAVKLLPTACPDHFILPKAPWTAVQYNGIALPDVCIAGGGPGRDHHVFLIGDWGGVLSDKGLRPADHRSKKFGNHHRNFIFGADDFAQQRVAEQMARRASWALPDYVINVGDNFYWGGVGTDKDGSSYGRGQGNVCGTQPPCVAEPSLQFQKIYEDIYRGPGLDGKPWLGVLGNHDYGGWKFNAAWDQAIGYSWSSERWLTPAQYWQAKVWYPDFSVDYFFVDTNFVDALIPGSDEGHNLCSIEHNPKSGGCKTTGPASVDECFGWFAKLWADQMEWLEKVLGQSVADWQILVTHFPPTFALQNFTYLQDKFGIDLFISGHTHKQEVHGEDEEAILGGCPYLISGGGGGITSEGLPAADGLDDMYGFMDLTLSKEVIKVEAISHGGQLRVAKRVHRRLPATTTSTRTATMTTATSTATTATTTSSTTRTLTASTTSTTTSSSSSRTSTRTTLTSTTLTSTTISTTTITTTTITTSGTSTTHTGTSLTGTSTISTSTTSTSNTATTTTGTTVTTTSTATTVTWALPTLPPLAPVATAAPTAGPHRGGSHAGREGGESWAHSGSAWAGLRASDRDRARYAARAAEEARGGGGGGDAPGGLRFQ